MTSTLIFIFGFVMGMVADNVMDERSVINNDDNRKLMMREIQEEMNKGYMPDLAKYKKKYNL